MNIVEIITKKKDGLNLTKEELDYAFNGYLNKTITDAQMSSLLMAIVINGMSFEETAELTDIFINSGETYDLSSLGNVLDKHSTGGVGDTTTMIVGPIIAACGLTMAKMSGRGLGHTGGTIDKLESIPGFNTNLTKEEFIEASKKVGFCISCQTDKLVPMDKVVYNLRNLTGTTESIPLIASSIMSKKIASGANIILVDVKVGTGALIKNEKDANTLSKWLKEIGSHFNRKVITLKTDMNEPLSDAIGNALEIKEAIEILKGKDTRLRSVSLEIATKLISAAKEISEDEAYKEAVEAIKTGRALEKFKEFVKNQGGDIDKLKTSNKVVAVKANRNGTLGDIDALEVGLLAVKLGANKTNNSNKIDHGTGIKIVKHAGDKVKVGDILAYLYLPKKVKLENDDFNCFKVE